MHGAIAAGFTLIALAMIAGGIAIMIDIWLEHIVNPPVKNNFYNETTQTYDDGEVVRAWVRAQ